MNEGLPTQYEQLLQQYLYQSSETTLYEGQQLSKNLIDQGISPEDILGFHIEAMKNQMPQLQPEVMRSFDFLLEVMIGYGLQYREHQSLREKQIQLQSELQVAADMQQTLLPPTPEAPEGMELGVKSVAAKKISGDYYHLHKNAEDSIGVAIADIIGKGIPAALCMSLIKYALESLIEQTLEPRSVMARINRVVERNIDPSMFITMIYGQYSLTHHTFSYATAGHEPGLFYNAKHDTFEDLSVKGPVLGLTTDAKYRNFTVEVDPGDMVILFSDGLTEVRNQGEFIERNEIRDLFYANKDLSAQEIVDTVHQELLSRSDFELHDDQTMVLLRRVV
ncbi:PP2C family protein-serine/threonine phosphatase [Caldalkalibacillus salinus]|uniref:PP2C family protein-serine/threonine phosphatase n=1 Tax=Caldalkalibacillus salinus TaxID=2803787 RepID=UPI0019250441|nr:PP2C family protein-serine/threonine phosphatase [Caldalkalibacillus salinus]